MNRMVRKICTAALTAAVTVSFPAAAEEKTLPDTVMIHDVPVKVDTIRAVADFIMEYEIGETKLEEISDTQYDVYVSHTMLSLLTAMNSVSLRELILYLAQDGVWNEDDKNFAEIMTLAEEDILGEMNPFDEGRGVICHIDVTPAAMVLAKTWYSLEPQ